MLIALMALCVSSWATPTTITWNAGNGLTSINVYSMDGNPATSSQRLEDITLTCATSVAGDYAGFYTYNGETDLSVSNGGTLTFSSALHLIHSIVINFDGDNSGYGYVSEPTEWESVGATLSWSGTASHSVELANAYGTKITSIVFTVEAIPTTTVTWNAENGLTSINLTEYTNNYYNNDYHSYTGQTVETIDGVTATISATADGANASLSTYESNTSISLSNGGTLTFSTALGQFLSIVIHYSSEYGYVNSPSEWEMDNTQQTVTWAGSASNSVVFESAYVDGITSIEFVIATPESAPVDPTPSSSTITWEYDDLKTIQINRRDGNDDAESATVKTITATADALADGDYCHLYYDEYGESGESSISVKKNGTLTFETESGNFSRIVISCSSYPSNPSNVSAGWVWDNTEEQLIWSGTAASSVTLECNDKTGGESYDIYFRIYAIEFTVTSEDAPVDPTPSYSSFTWESRQVSHVSLWCNSKGDSYTSPVIKNIITTLTKTTNIYGNCYFQNNRLGISNCGELKFKSIIGDLGRIVITCSSVSSASDLSGVWQYNSEAGTLTWAGISAAEEVTLSGNISCTISSIEFFYTPAAAPYVGTQFQDNRNLVYEITGAHTAKLVPQYTDGSVVVLDSYEYEGITYYITEIEDYAFYNYNDLNVEIANIHGGVNIARIGAHAFENCYRLYDAILESSVIDEIGDAAFKGCQLLHAVECNTEMPPVLGDDVFTGNTYMNHINVYSSVVNDYKAASGWSAYSTMIGAKSSLPAVGEQFVWHNQTTDGVYQVTATSPREAKVLPYPAEINAIFPITREGTLIIPEIADYIHKSYAVTGIGANAYKDSARFNMVLMPEAMKTIETGAFLNCTGVEKVFFLWDDLTGITWADGSVGAEFKTAASGETKIFVPQGRLDAYRAWAPAWASCMLEGELFDVTASVDPKDNIRYYRTFYSSTTDYMMPPSVWAHVGYVDGDEFILNPIAFDGDILPRGTAVVLESETPTYRLIPTGNNAPLYTGQNDLIGTDIDILRTSVGNNGENVYVLGKQATINGHSQVGMGMYRYTGTTLGAHKAYMIYDAPSGPNSAPIRFLFKQEDQTTGIENVQDNVPCTKILRDGQLIIIKDGKEYNAQGLIIK